MEKETITDNLEKLLMAIHRQVVVIRDSEGQIPKIEMDKTLSNIRALYEQFTVLNYLNANPPVEKKSIQEVKSEPKPEPKSDSPFVPIIEKQPEAVQPEPIVVEMPVKPVPVERPVEIDPEIVSKYAPRQAVPVEEPKVIVHKLPDPEPVKPVIQTLVAKESKPLSTGDGQRLGDKLRLQKIDDIHKAIVLSDKFLFMNELFEAENNAYKEAVDMLNRLDSFEEAEHYIDSLSARYAWYNHPRTEKKFRDVVARKFA